MDLNIVHMVADAYDETVSEALAQGNSASIAHHEGLTAAAMFLAAMTGQDDLTARAKVESLGLPFEAA